MKFPIVAYADLVSNLLPVIAGLSRIGSLTRPMRLFLMLVIISACVEFGSFIMGRFRIHNLWLLQFYHLIDFILVLTIFRRWLRLRTGRRVTFWLIPLFTASWIVAKFTVEPLTVADQYTYSAASIIILPVAILLLFQLVIDETNDFVKDSRFWMTCGVFIYFAGNFILFSVFQWVTGLALIDFVTVWTVHWSLNVIVNIIYTIGFLLAIR